MEFKSWLQEKERSPRILWITGMKSSGSKPRMLASMGYDVKSIGTTTNYFAAYLGRFKRYHPFQKTANLAGTQHVNQNIKKHDEEIQGFQPDVVIGTSQGGAIAMKLGYRYPKAKFILGAPAWKIFNAQPESLPPDTVIIHGKKDIVVPIEDSIELSKKYRYKLRIYDFKHEIPLSVIKPQVDQFLEQLGITVPMTMPSA